MVITGIVCSLKKVPDNSKGSQKFQDGLYCLTQDFPQGYLLACFIYMNQLGVN